MLNASSGELNPSLQRLVWEYLDDEERTFLGLFISLPSLGGFLHSEKTAKPDKRSIQKLAAYAASAGWLSALRELGEAKIKVGYAEVMCKAASAGLPEVMDWAERNGATNFVGAFSCAAASGQLAAMKKIWAEHEITFFRTNISCLAARGGHIDIIEFCKDKGRCIGGHIYQVFEVAAFSGQIAVMEYCVKHGAKNFDDAMAAATANNQVSAIQFCLQNRT